MRCPGKKEGRWVGRPFAPEVAPSEFRNKPGSDLTAFQDVRQSISGEFRKGKSMPGRPPKKPSWWSAFGESRVVWLVIVIVVLLLVFLATNRVVSVHHIAITL
jgi:hypothetical protein